MDQPVWLDRSKSWEEMRPARVIHKIHRYLVDCEKNQQQKLEVTKFVGPKHVNVGVEKACYTLKGELKWTTWARN
eukprot:2751026-Karenia_brevis.AAC.1